MSYYKRVVKRRSACMTDEEILSLRAAAKRWSAHFQARDGFTSSPVDVRTVLCPYCRERHQPAGVDACMALPRKSANADSSGTSTLKSLDAGPLSQYSELWAFLTAVTFPDGALRRTGRISLSCDKGMLGLLLTDDETSSYAFLNGTQVTELLEEAELRLADGTLSFRPSKWTKGKRGS
jgi:hypothetical protein